MGPFAQGWTEESVEEVVARGDPQELLYVPIVVGMNADSCERSWAEAMCLELAEHENFNVRGNAMLGLGHIARVCRDLDTDRAVPVLSRGLKDPHDYVRGHAHDAACDLHLYLGEVVPGYDVADTQTFVETIRDIAKQHDA